MSTKPEMLARMPGISGPLLVGHGELSSVITNQPDVAGLAIRRKLVVPLEPELLPEPAGA